MKNAVTDRPLSFCMMTTFYPPYNFGGDGIFVHRLSNELARLGHRVDVIHCADAYRLAGGWSPAGAYENHPNVTVHRLKSHFGPLSPFATQQTGFPFFKSAEILRVLKKGFDVIHYHNISLLGPKVLEHGSGIKLYTMHEYWLVCPTHVLFKFNREACRHPQCLLCTLSYGRPPQWWRYSALLETAAKHVDAFIAPTRFSMNKHREMGFDASISHLPHFVPAVDEASPAPELNENQAPEKPYFLFVGRLEKLKGVQTLVPVFRRYAKSRLLLAGAGAYEPQLRRLAAGCVNVEFLGHLSESQLRHLYRGATGIILPSLCFESFSLALVEALSHKTPVIGRKLGAVAEMIAQSGGGIAYDTEDELVAAMETLVADPERRRTLGERGYEAYKKNWTVEAHMKRYFEIIGDIADRKPPSKTRGLLANETRLTMEGNRT